MYICVYVYVCTYTYIFLTCLPIFLVLISGEWGRILDDLHMYIDGYKLTSVHSMTYIYIYKYIHTCTYTHIHINIHTYIHILIYTYISTHISYRYPDLSWPCLQAIMACHWCHIYAYIYIYIYIYKYICI